MFLGFYFARKRPWNGITDASPPVSASERDRIYPGLSIELPLRFRLSRRRTGQSQLFLRRANHDFFFWQWQMPSPFSNPLRAARHFNTAPCSPTSTVLAGLGEEGATPARRHISESPTAFPIFPLRDSSPPSPCSPTSFHDGSARLVLSASVERKPRLVACDPGSARVLVRWREMINPVGASQVRHVIPSSHPLQPSNRQLGFTCGVTRLLWGFTPLGVERELVPTRQTPR